MRNSSVSDLEALYRARYGAFVRVACAIAGDSTGGVDAVHDAFASAISSLDSFRGEAPLEAWVWRIVVRASRAARRFERALPAAAGANGDRSESDVHGVRAFVAALPERQREAVFLRYFADLDYRAIAEALGVEVGTVSAMLNAAHRSLRRSLEEASS